MTTTPTDFRAVLAALPAREPTASGRLDDDAPSQSTPAVATVDSRPWQFSLRTLLFGVAIVSGFSAILLAIGAAAAAIVIWLCLLIAAHVAANAWGTHTWRPGAPRAEEPAPAPRIEPADVARHAAPRSRLGGEIRLSPALPVLAALGALAGGSLGSYVLMLAYGEREAWSAIAFGALAATVLGGFLGFLAGSFCEVGLRSLREATAHGRHGR